MDLQMKLANDRFAEAYRSPEARSLPEWAVWRDEAWGTTFEPVVFVYNKRLLTGSDIPQTHGDLLHLLESRSEKFSGNITTYDTAALSGRTCDAATTRPAVMWRVRARKTGSSSSWPFAATLARIFRYWTAASSRNAASS